MSEKVYPDQTLKEKSTDASDKSTEFDKDEVQDATQEEKVQIVKDDEEEEYVSNKEEFNLRK